MSANGKGSTTGKLELWAGIECTLNRVGDVQHDQLQLTGHYGRLEDLDRIAALGVRTVRYPVLWEHVEARRGAENAWAWCDAAMERMQVLGLDPIVGLVHHGSGPRQTNLLAEDFATGLAHFAAQVAHRYPWVTRFTPVNEPLTTARFSALYGVWYPHKRDDAAFVRAVVNQVHATRLSMNSIRAVTADAQLIQTEDLGKAHATSSMQYQADFENDRRWLTFDLLSAAVTPSHPMFTYLVKHGITHDELAEIADAPCVPDVFGINHYVTSERWLDERIERYPRCNPRRKRPAPVRGCRSRTRAGRWR